MSSQFDKNKLAIKIISIIILAHEHNYNCAWYDSPVNIAFYLPGSIPVYSFSLLMAIGSSVGLWRIAKQSEEKHRRFYLDVGLWVLLAALIGARIAYTVGQWAYFRRNVIEIFELYRGGLSWPGALAGGVLALFVLARKRKMPAGVLADVLLPLGASLAVSAWMGSWLTGYAYGIESSSWWTLPAVDEWGVVSERWPVQLVGALLTLSLFWLVEKKRRSFRLPGQAACIYMIGVSVVMFALTYLRADPMPVWNGLRWDAWAAILFAAFGLLSLLAINNFKLDESESSVSVLDRD